MRLELEPIPTHPGVDLASETAVRDRAAEAADHLREGIRAAQSGSRMDARRSLLRAVELDPQSESAWLWLSSISEYPEELLAFLTNVLEINPRNARALEWSAATRSLLAKNFVQRGIDAAESNQKEMAVQHFNQALEYDERSSMAWLWLASLSESNEGKLSYLEKALEFDPENESARTGYQAARNAIREGLLAEARSAAVSGNSQAANDLLDAVIAEEPDAEDAWVLKSHIAVAFDEKIAAFRRVLEINPDNTVARAGLDSLTAIIDAVGVASPAQQPVQAPEAAEAKETPAGSYDDEPAAAAFTGDDAGVEATVWEPIADEPAEAEDEQPEAASPFDSYADEPVVDFNGTMLMTASEFGFELAEAVEASAEAGAINSETAESTSFAGDSEELAQQPDEPVAVEESPVPSSLEPEELTYELSSETSSVEVNEADSAPLYEAEVYSAVDDAPGRMAPIAIPTGNPFASEEFRNEPDLFKTVVSVDRDPEMPAAARDHNPVTSEPAKDNGFDAPFDSARYTGTIPMPVGDLDQSEPTVPTGFETRVVGRTEEEPETVSPAAACPFCRTVNDVQAIACNSCLAVLTLADLELILANHHADKAVLRQAVEQMEREKASRELTEAELTTLGIGHLNLRNLQFGYNYLHEAAQVNPNNFVLSSQANALLIRLEEIKQQEQAHGAMSKGKTILVVDDSPTVRKLIAGKLEKCGHEVFCSADGVEAMEQLATLRPDLILLDITMPRMDGYQVCKLIRADELTKNTPVVMISGKDGFFDKVRGRMAGASGYITKPFGPETLMKAVESYLSHEA